MYRKSGFSAFVDSSGVETIAHSTVRMYVPVDFPVRVEVVARSRSGLFSRRHGLDLLGWVHLPELRMDFVFRPHGPTENGHDDSWGSATVVPSGFRLPIPAQAIDRNDPERRDLWFMTSEPDRQPPWLEHYAGRCDQHSLTFVRQVQAKATLDVSCRADESHEGRGSKVEVWGDVAFERSMSMRLLLRDTDRSTASAEMDSKEMTVIERGSRVAMERQGVSALVGPQPWIGVRVSDGQGRELCPEHALGYNRRFW